MSARYALDARLRSIAPDWLQQHAGDYRDDLATLLGVTADTVYRLYRAAGLTPPLLRGKPARTRRAAALECQGCNTTYAPKWAARRAARHELEARGERLPCDVETTAFERFLEGKVRA